MNVFTKLGLAFGTIALIAACGGSDGVGSSDEDAGDSSTSSGGGGGDGSGGDGSGGDGSGGSGGGTGGNASGGSSGSPDGGDLDGAAPDSSVTPDGGLDASTDSSTTTDGSSTTTDGSASDAADACDELEGCCAAGQDGAACRQIATTGPPGNCEAVHDIFCNASPPDAAAPPDGGGSGCAGLSVCCAALSFPFSVQCNAIATTGIDLSCDVYAPIYCP